MKLVKKMWEAGVRGHTETQIAFHSRSQAIKHFRSLRKSHKDDVYCVEHDFAHEVDRNYVKTAKGWAFEISAEDRKLGIWG